MGAACSGHPPLPRGEPGRGRNYPPGPGIFVTLIPGGGWGGARRISPARRGGGGGSCPAACVLGEGEGASPSVFLEPLLLRGYGGLMTLDYVQREINEQFS